MRSGLSIFDGSDAKIALKNVLFGTVNESFAIQNVSFDAGNDVFAAANASFAA